MSSIKLESNASGTGIFTIASPNSNTNRTLSIPDVTTTIVGTDATQTLTNKTIQGGAITSGTAVASTSGTSIDFTGIPSWVKRITLMLDGVSWNASVSPLIQIGDSGGLESTGYNAISGSTDTGAGALAAIYSTGFGMFTGWSAATLVSGTLTFNLLNASTNTWAAYGALLLDAASDYCITITGTMNADRFIGRMDGGAF